MDPDWNDLKVIAALARGGSLAAAARELRLDHSTVSRRLAALETALGTTLVLRNGKELVWTAAGRQAIACSEVVDREIAGMTLALRAALDEIAGTVRISCPSGMVPTLLGVLPAARARHPRLAIEIIGDNRTVDLGRGEADIALRMFRPAEPGFVCRQVFEVGWGVFAAERYLARHGRPATPGDLAGHQLVLYVETMHRVVPMRWLEAHRGERTSITRVDNTEVASQTTAAGGGIGVLPCFVAAEIPGLVRLFPDPVATNTGWLVYHESLRGNARVRATIDAIVAFLESQRAVMAGHA